MSTDDAARRIKIGLDAHGRPLARKLGDLDRIGHEAEVLSLVQMPGVVRLVHHDQMTGELGLAWTGGRSLADPPAHRPVADVLGIARALAGTVAALHAAGVVHRRIEASHVLVTDDGPILTGFAEAVVVTDGDLTTSHVDVIAIGRLIDVLLGPPSVPARPESRPTALRRVPARSRRSEHGRQGDDRSNRTTAPDHTVATLRRVARRAQDRSVPCTIEELCSMLDTIAAPSPVPTVSILLDSGRRGRLRGILTLLGDRRRVVALIAVAASIPTALFLLPRLTAASGRVASAGTPAASPADVVRTSDDTHPVDMVPSTDDTVHSTATSRPATSTSTPSATSTTAGSAASESSAGQLIWPPPTPLAADPQQFTVRSRGLETGIVEVSGVRYRLAADPQDRWLTGDWNCDETASLAILRLPSGAVDVFDAWPESGRSVTSRRVALIAGAVDLAATAEDCARLAVTDATGNVITLVAS